MENCGGFSTGGSRAEVGKWTSAPTSATFSSSSFERSLFPGFVGAGPSQLEFHPQQHHLTCLKLGKRQYYGEAADQEVGFKREKPGFSGGLMIPRCQVEGCNKPLLDAKDYHRRHKVCEMHSKAPSVVVLGAEQRFCQQCSRFHAITEFDSTKRSCRRRLAGHNERRRKNANEAVVRNPNSLDSSLFGSRFAYLSPSSPGRALSLLSSKMPPWIPTPELSSRSSAALRELIAENRASLLARQLFSNQSVITTYVPQQNQVPPPHLLDGWNQFQDSGNHVTLDLMQDPNSASFEFLASNKSKEAEEECCEIWKSLEGTHVV